MTRATAYRVQTNAAPMSGRTIIAPMVRDRHPTDRREAKRGMIRAMLCFVVGMYAIVLVFG